MVVVFLLYGNCMVIVFLLFLSIDILYRYLLYSIYEHDIQILILFIHLIINEDIYSYTILFPRAVSNQ